MPLINYQNYDRTLAGFGVPILPEPVIYENPASQSWVRRNWPTVMQILGAALFLSGTIAKAFVNRSLPPGQIQQRDFESIVVSLQSMNPTLPREQIIAKLCEVLGNRAPVGYCVGAISPVPPVCIQQASLTQGMGGIPPWMMILGIGAAFFLFR